MKNKVLPLLAISLITLTSCKFLNIISSSEEEVDVYDLDKINNEDDISQAFDYKATVRFKDNEPLIPYVTLQEYANFYESHYAKGVNSRYSKSPSGVTWSVFKDDELYFLTEINFTSKQIIVGGSLDATFKDDDSPRDLKALNYGANIKYDGKYLSGNGFAYYYFNNQAINYFSYHNNFYISLGFLDMTYSSQSGIYFYYNYNRIVSAHEVDRFDDRKYKVDNNLLNTNQEMKLIIDDIEEMPLYLRKYNANLFLYFLDNFYGLKEEKQMNNAKSYTSKIKTYNDLFSANNYKRVQAIADSLSYLDDNHTALVSGSYAWNETEFNRWKYGDGVKNRAKLNAQLTATRLETYQKQSLIPGTDILYSNDNKTAMYMFNSFVFGDSKQVFNDDESIKDSAHLFDTYIDLIRVFNEIKNKGGVNNVVLDISTNGGGTIGVMMKLLSLISKNNESDVHYVDMDTHQFADAYTKVDINNDKINDLEDCFGDDFNIFILTSDCSFSAANAFACFASYENICTVIGQTSGGGECAVGIHYLPNGEYLYHSSNLHLGYYDKDIDVFNGFESGAQPTFEIKEVTYMYDIEYLNENLVNYI